MSKSNTEPLPLRILYAEDSPQDAELNLNLLKKAGFELTAEIVDRPESFRDSLRSARFDIILSDYNLNTWNAVEALEIVQSESPETPFILVTGTIGEEAAVDSIKRGVTDYVIKDHPARLASAVRRALEEKRLREERNRAETDRRRAEEALRLSEQRFEIFMDNSPVMAWIKDEESLYLYCNATMARTLRKTKDEIIGHRGADLWPKEVAAIQSQHDLAVLTSGQAQEFSEPIADAEHKREAWVLRFPFEDPSGRRLVGGMSIEVTERRRLEQQLQQAQKMEAIGQLAGGVAHDFNNLLTIISGYSEMLAASLLHDEALLNQVTQIQTAAHRAARLTKQLLAFGRRQRMAVEILDINEVVAHIQDMLPGLVREDIEIKMALGEGLGHVQADATQIEQILVNLIVNARDAMPQGGTVLLETTNVDVTPAFAAQHLGMKPGSYVMMAVKDTGCGMDAGTQARVFEPFFTTKEEGKGTGLGLATVYGIVKQSGGFISVESAVTKGSTFYVYLPRINEPSAVRKSKTASALNVKGSETILIAEDEQFLRELVRGILKSRGYRVLEATCGEEALEISGRYPGEIDLLLTDVVMPKVNGPELAARLMMERPAVKILYMSGYADTSVVLHGVRDVRYAYLAKPFTPQELELKVRQVLDSASVLESAA